MNRTWLCGSFAVLSSVVFASTAAAQSPAEQIAALMESVNAQLEATGENYRLAMAEYLMNDGYEMGVTVLSKDVGDKQFAGFDWVPFDDRRTWSASGGSAITYAIDTSIDAVPPLGGLTQPETDAAIVAAMDTWNAVSCAPLGLTRNPDFGLDVGVVAFMLTGGAQGSPFILADIQHAGWRDLNLAPGVLGITFTFAFNTDVDGDGNVDVAFREIYYDPDFPWVNNGGGIDTQTIATHEAGHGLNLVHFGMQFFDTRGGVHLAPDAVMNAIYDGPQQTLAGPDVGGLCTGWGDWPLQ